LNNIAWILLCFVFFNPYASVFYFSDFVKILDESRRWQAMYENLSERIEPFQVIILYVISVIDT